MENYVFAATNQRFVGPEHFVSDCMKKSKIFDRFSKVRTYLKNYLLLCVEFYHEK
ncbi:MAG: hypothetical protein ABFC34_05660 [Methanobacterium sp.]